MKKKIKIIFTLMITGSVITAGAWLFIKGSSLFVQQTVHSKKNRSPEQTHFNEDKNNDLNNIESNVHADSVKETASSEVPAELRHLKLVGTAFNSSDCPYAVIADTVLDKQNLYKPGDIVNNATITDILSSTVLLEYHGKKIRLKLEKPETTETLLSTEDLLNEPPDAFLYTTEQDVENAWEQTQNLMTLIELNQYTEGNEPNGVIIERVTPESVFDKIGFKPGDILKKVDDMEMTIADDALEVYNCIRTKPSVQFTVIRDGGPEPVILEYNHQMLEK